MILSFIYICDNPQEELKPLGFALCIQNLPRDLGNVNEQKIISDTETLLASFYDFLSLLYILISLSNLLIVLCGCKV